jgi:hypothetical protein
MGRNFIGILLFVLTFANFASAEQSGSPVKVYVFARGGTDGFVDSGRLEDSVKDLQEAIAKHKTMIWTFTAKEADITLEVADSGKVNAGTQSNTTINKGIFGGLQSNTTVKEKTLPNVTAILHVRGSDYSKELSVTAQRFWKDLAKNIANQLDDWIKVNRSRLNQIRSEEDAPR